MAPKTPLNRQLSVTPNVNAQLPQTQNAHEMPPPPDPPHGMLVPEINALSRCMQASPKRAHNHNLLTLHSDSGLRT